MRAWVTVVVLAVAAAVVLSSAGAAADGGPSPGVSTGWDGIVSKSGVVRYVTVTTEDSTVVEKIGTGRGRVLQWLALRGIYGIPVVAYDGTPTGLTRDGTRLVLSTYPGAGELTRLVVLDTKRLSVRDRIALRGIWSVDALSTDGGKLYLIQYLPGVNIARYRVRAYDLAARRLLPGAITDKTEPGPMVGVPLRRVESPEGDWAYTLYQRPVGKPFVHALDTAAGSARCLDVDAWHGSQDALLRVRMRLSADGRSLVLSERGLSLKVPVP